MNWDVVSALAEFIGALAVLATLIYLSIQVRHATSAMRLESKQRRLEAWRQDARERARNPQLHMEMMAIGRDLDKELNDREQFVYANYLTDLFDGLQADYELHKEGIYSEQDFEYLVVQEIARILNDFPRTSVTWRNGLGNNYEPGFREFVDDQFQLAGV